LKERGASALILFETRFSSGCLAVSTPVIGPSNLLFFGGGSPFSVKSRLALVCSSTPRISCLCRHQRVSQLHFEVEAAEAGPAKKEEEEEEEEEGEQRSMSLGEGSEDEGLVSHLPSWEG
jgi:hypothetical protein